MLKQEQVKTPELKRMLAVKDRSQAIGEFLEWLEGQEIILAKEMLNECEHCGFDNDGLWPLGKRREQLLAEYFKIDLAKCEAERRALLDAVREDNR